MPAHGVKNLTQVDDEYQSKMSELTGVEERIRKLQDREGEIRAELCHLEIKRNRLLGVHK